MIAGSIEIQLLANLARLQKDMDSAKSMVGGAMSNIEKTVGLAQKAILGLGAGFTIAAFISNINKVIDVLGNLDDMAQKTGSSVENLSRLQKVATQYGGDWDAVNTSLIKLSKGLGQVDDASNKTTTALKAIGISSDFIKKNDPSQVFVEVAKRLQNYKDSAAKVALVTDAMGKSAADLLPYLNDVADNVDRFSAASAKSAAQAAAFQDQLGGLKVKADEAFTSIARRLLPSLTELLDKLAKNVEQSGLLLGALKGVFDLGEIVIFGTEQEQRANRMKTLVNDIKNIESQLSSGNVAPTPGARFGTQMTEEKAFDLRRQAYAKNLELQQLTRQSENAKAAGSPYVTPNSGKDDLNYTSGAAANDVAAMAKVASAYDSLTKKSNDYLEAIKFENAEGEKLTEGQKTVANLRQFLADKTMTLTAAQKANIQSLITQAEAEDSVSRSQADRKDRIAALVEYQMKYNEQQKAATAALDEATHSYYDLIGNENDQIKAVQNQIDVLKFGTVATTQMQNARLLEAAAVFEQGAAYAEQNGVSQENVKSMLNRAEALRKLAAARGELASKQQELTNLTKWKELASNVFDNVYSGLADALFRGFERGESFGKNFIARMKDLFKTTTLQLGAQLILEPVKKSVLESFGSITSGAGGASGASSSLSMIDKLTNLVTGKSGNLSDNFISGISSQIGSLGSMLGSTGLQTFANGLAVSAGSVSSAGASVAASQLGTSSALSVGKFVGSYGPYIGAAIQALTGDLKGAAFTAAGAAIGSIVPGIGTAVGAAIGSILGSFVGGGLSYNNVNESATYSNGTFTQGALSNNSRGDIAYGALPALNGLGKQFGDSVGTLLKAFGESDKQTQNFSVKFGKQLEAGLSYTLANGKSGYVGKWGTNYGDTSEAAVSAFIEDVLSKGIIGALKISNLSDAIKSLFDKVSTSGQVANLINATVKLKDAQDELASRFGLTIDQAAKLSSATGLAGDDLSNFISALADTAAGLKSQFKDVIAARATLAGIVGQALPDSVDAFDNIIKGIDKSTADGINKALSLLSNRAAFVAYTTTIDNLKSGVAGAVFGLKSPQEQVAGMQADLEAMFKALGLAVPKSKAELIALGQSIDYTTEAGLTLANAFPSLVTAFTTTQNGVEGLANSLDALNINKFKTLVDYTRAQSYLKNGFSLADLPSYDVGTPFVQGDQIAQIHHGERIFTANENAELMARLTSPAANQAALVDEIRALRSEVALLRSNSQIENIAILQKTDQMATSLRQMNDDGVMIRDIDTTGKPQVLDVRVVT